MNCGRAPTTVRIFFVLSNSPPLSPLRRTAGSILLPDQFRARSVGRHRGKGRTRMQPETQPYRMRLRHPADEPLWRAGSKVLAMIDP